MTKREFEDKVLDCLYERHDYFHNYMESERVMLNKEWGTDFEYPEDSNGDNVYNLTLTASDASDSSSIDIEVSVLNVGEESDPPTFSEFTFSTTSVDVSTEAKDITFTLRVKDESGIDINDNRYPFPYLAPDGFNATIFTRMRVKMPGS